MWTRFMDMHSGGGQKEKWAYIYIEATKDKARIIFYNRFGHNPDRVTCTCCGNDYSYDEYETLAEATAYNRNCEWSEKTKKYIEKKRRDGLYSSGRKYMSIAQYKKDKDVLFIPKSKIKPEELRGEVPEQGYVWQD